VNPFTGEGKKSVALEIARDLGNAPDVVICPVGDGCIVGGLYKGFGDLLDLGLIDHLPRLYGVQAEGASPIVKAFESGIDITPLSHVTTIADSICVGHPRDGAKALRATRQSHGAMLAVSDEEIFTAQRVLASKAGIFAEPAAAAPMAGLVKLREKRLIGEHESVVILVTGHGLKDIDTALRNVPRNDEITKPDLESVAKRVQHLIQVKAQRSG
jgi:threonine synthase